MNKKMREAEKQHHKYRRGRHIFWRVLIGLLFIAAAGIVVCSALGEFYLGVSI